MIRSRHNVTTMPTGAWLSLGYSILASPTCLVASVRLGELLQALLALAAWVGLECCTFKFGQLGIASRCEGCRLVCLQERLSATGVVEACLEARKEDAS